MATNKHALIRYEALDRCFSNKGRKFFIEDLIQYVSNALYEYTGSNATISRRQIFKDINFMRDVAGFNAPIIAIKEGKRAYYKYEDSNYSIALQQINPIEAELLKNALEILKRFKGIPQFEFIQELSLKLKKSFHLEELDHIIFFDQNEYLKNLEYLAHLLKAIQDKDVIQVNYKSFNQLQSEEFIFHPYFLKQYNKRWFLIGQRTEFNIWTTLALDRIISFQKAYDQTFVAIKEDPEEYFEDVIGVSKPMDAKVQKVRVKLSKAILPYIESKPIHPSQKVVQREEESLTIELEIIPNYEFYSLMLSFGNVVEVISPTDVRLQLMKKIEQTWKLYT